MIRIIEIGFLPLLSSAFPDQVIFVDTRLTYANPRRYERMTESVRARLGNLVRNAVRVARVAHRRDYDAVVIRCLGSENPQTGTLGLWGKRALGWALLGLTVYASRGRALVVIDMTDHRTIHRRDLRLLKRCRIYFKRELADNLWGSLESCLPAGRCVGAASADPAMQEMQELRAKLHPISLGIEDVAPAVDNSEKVWDIFYSGSNKGQVPARIKTEDTLRQLEALGLRVNHPTKRLSRKEFTESIRRSWLCLSPGGFGWDCYRHYEIPAHGSCPVFVSSPNLGHAPFQHGVNAFYLQMGEDWACRIVDFLRDKEHLRAMTESARQHVLEYHTFSALAEYMMRVIENDLARKASG